MSAIKFMTNKVLTFRAIGWLSWAVVLTSSFIYEGAMSEVNQIGAILILMVMMAVEEIKEAIKDGK